MYTLLIAPTLPLLSPPMHPPVAPPATPLAAGAARNHSSPLLVLLCFQPAGVAAPGYLDGSMAGDRGFDPMGLGANPKMMT